MGLTRKQQLGATEEVIDGTGVNAALTSAANFKHLAIEPSADLDIAIIDRRIFRGTLTNEVKRLGRQTMRVTFGIELAGHSHATPDIPTWDLFLKACGYWSAATSYIDTTVAAFAGTGVAPIRHLGVITQTTTGATAEVLHDTYDDVLGTRVYVKTDTITGAPNNSDIWTWSNAAADTVTFIPTTVPTDAGQTWYPADEILKLLDYSGGTLTGDLVADEVVSGSGGGIAQIVSHDTVAETMVVRVFDGDFSMGETVTSTADGDNITPLAAPQSAHSIPSLTLALRQDGSWIAAQGCRGNFTLDMSAGETGQFNFDFEGSFYGQNDLPAITGIGYESELPPIIQGNCLKLAIEGDTDVTDFHSAPASRLSLSSGNTLAAVLNFCKAGGVGTSIITDHAPTGTVDPQQFPESVFPYRGRFRNGAIASMRMDIGADAANRFHLSIPGVQFTSLPNGDREGLLTYEAQFECTGGTRDNDNDAPGSNNEIILTYLII